MSDTQRNFTVTLTLSAQEFGLIQDAVDELLNDSDLIWGNCDQADSDRLYDEVCRLAKRLAKIEQMEVIPH